MRRWWFPCLIWTLVVVTAAVVLLLVYAQADGPSRCIGCPPTSSVWNELVAWLVVMFGVIAIVIGNVVILAVAGVVRFRRDRTSKRQPGP